MARDEAVSGMEQHICDGCGKPRRFHTKANRGRMWYCSGGGLYREVSVKPAPEPLIGSGEPTSARLSIGDLERILNADADTPIQILPNGEIVAADGSQVKPLTMRENLGGEYGSGASDGEMTELFIGAVEQITGKRPENITHFGPSAASSDPALKAQEGNNNALTESGWKRIAGGAIDVAGMSPEDDVNADMVAYLKRNFIAPVDPLDDLASLAKKLAEQLQAARNQLNFMHERGFVLDLGPSVKRYDAVLAEAKKAGCA